MFHSEYFYVDFVTQILITVLGTNKGRSEKKEFQRIESFLICSEYTF